MIPPAHALVGWAVAHVRAPDRSTRLWCVLASVVPDLDSAGLLFGWDAYERYHHVLLHNVPFGVLVTAISARWVGLRPLPLLSVFLAFLSHLVGDYLGSGAGWGISPYLPFSPVEYVYTMTPRDILLPNLIVTVAAVVAAVLIAARHGRTPLEFVHPAAERLVVDTIQLRARATPCGRCETRARVRCWTCHEAVCATHAEPARQLRPRCRTCASPPA